MKKIFLTVGILIALGIAYKLISPLFINKTVHEGMQNLVRPGATLQVLSQGTFTGQGPHNGQGTAKLVQSGNTYFIRLEDDFQVTNGPDLFVYLGKNGQYDPSAQLAPLKGNIGGQNYEIPASLNPAGYTEVWIWCRSFRVPFAVAELK